MQIPITLTLNDLTADQILADAALAYGIQGVTTEEAIAAIKARLLDSFKAAAVKGASIREQKAKEAAIAGDIDASIQVG